MQLCQIQLDNNNAFSLGRHDIFKWTVTNADPNNLAFELEYGGGDTAGNKTRCVYMCTCAVCVCMELCPN